MSAWRWRSTTATFCALWRSGSPVSGVINPPARNKRSYWTHDDLNGDAADWLEKAEERPGSWWPDWDAWMKSHSSGTVPAPKQPGNARYQAIEEAPGRYVKQKSN